MGEYYIFPEPRGSVFPPNVLTDMCSWLEEKPTYQRSDGVYMLCCDYEYRDSVLRRGGQDEFTASAEAIRVAPEGVELSILGCGEMAETIRDFIGYCQDRHPCTFVDASFKPLTASDYVDIVVAMNHGCWYPKPPN